MTSSRLLLFRREDPGYEARRRAAMWNARVPDRFPDVIAVAHDEADVVTAVKLARAERLRVAVRSGGHSWAGNHVRDGGMLLDVHALKDATLDRSAMRATAGPGKGGSDLADDLARVGLFFPTGHCRGVCLGGYLLQGGFGWHGRELGMACESVIGLDLVTPDGERLHASPEENPDLYWAARGAGPGFFCVVTRFHLRVYPRPRVIGFGGQAFPMSALEPVLRWAHAIGPEVPRSVELQLLVSQHAAGIGGPGIEVFAPVFTDSIGHALRDLRFLRTSPMRRRARWTVPFAPMPLSLMYRAVMKHYPDHHRFAVDNLWTHASIDELLPPLTHAVAELPPAPSHLLWLNWHPPARRTDMAFSVEDRIYLALYGGWSDAADDGRHAGWAERHARAMRPLATGCQLADENLGRNPARFLSDENLRRMDAVRDARDPERRFHPWMGRP